MFYRVLDDYGYPYPFGYNERNLKNIAYRIFNIESDFRIENSINQKELHKLFKAGIRSIGGYNIEQQNKPFNEKDINYF